MFITFPVRSTVFDSVVVIPFAVLVESKSDETGGEAMVLLVSLFDAVAFRLSSVPELESLVMEVESDISVVDLGTGAVLDFIFSFDTGLLSRMRIECSKISCVIMASR